MLAHTHGHLADYLRAHQFVVTNELVERIMRYFLLLLLLLLFLILTAERSLYTKYTCLRSSYFIDWIISISIVTGVSIV